MPVLLNDGTITDLTGPLEHDDQVAGMRESVNANLKRIALALIKQFCEGLVQDIATDANASIVVFVNDTNIRHTGVLTADRVLTLSNTDAYEGATFWITRTGGGAFNLNVANHDATVLKGLVQNTWGKFVYNGTNWYLAAAGEL